MAAKKVFELNEASFVDLKAELIRKESQVKREKLGSEQKASRQPKKPPVWAKVKKEAKAANSAPPHKQEELSYEEQQILQKSRQALEAKAALYEKMAKGEIEDDDDNEDGGRFLVDFHKKVYSKDDNNQEESGGLKDEDIPPPPGPEEEWVDYVDSLGRARRCLRKDLKQLQDMDKDMNARKSPPTLLSEDMRREMMRQKWEQEEEEAMNKPVGPVHYQDMRFDEIRNHGVGYYQFSTNEEERQEQMKTLDKLREQTMEQRVRAQKLKDKRKAALDARLAKVRERKLKKLKASGALNEERIEESESTEDKTENSSDIVREKTTEVAEGKENSFSEADGGKTIKKAGVEDRLHVLPPEEETMYSRKPEKKAALPEWAQHKIKETDRPRPSRTDPREERDQQFAPPAFYYEQSTGGKTTKNSRTEPSKLFKPKDNINHYGQERKSENRETPYQGQQLPQQPPPHPPDFPLLPPPPQEYVRPTWTGYQWQPPPRIPPPPFPQQLPWQPNFPFNVPPPPPSLWRPNIPSWQPPQGSPPIGTVPTSGAHAVWSENSPNSSTILLGGSSKSDCTSSISSENVGTNTQGDKFRERTIPSKQKVAEFVAQFRS